MKRDEPLELWIQPSRIPQSGQEINLAPDKEELEIIADEAGVDAVLEFSCIISLLPWRRTGLKIKGVLSCVVRQTCVATLEPLENPVNDTFERYFLSEARKGRDEPEIIDGEMVLDPERDDFPDMVSGDRLNLWEIAIEQMVLTVDIFPRASNVEPIDVMTGSEDVVEEATTPFSHLKTLISEKKSKN